MTETQQPSAAGFYGLGIAPKLLSALDALNFKVPTPIQHKAIPPASEGKDMVGIAQTGTGKTIAFSIPMIQRLAAAGQGKGLVLVPTRELALQVAEVVRKFAPMLGMNIAVVIGGESLHRQTQELRKGPRIIIATPGRLIDHIGQRTVSLADVRVLVLDEADRMFDMGFAPQIEKVMAVLPKDRQTMLFSATMPDEIMKLASRNMKLPIRIEVARPGTAAEKVEQELFIVDRGDKNALLAKLLDKYWGSVLLFVRTKHNAKKIARAIREMPHSAAEIHSNRSLAQRRDALEGFKSGKYRVLVATDIAARGIDVTGIELVINYDLPDEDGNYVHRIGRTGRAGQPGRAITFAAPDQGRDVRNIERLIRMPLTRVQLPDVAAVDFGADAAPRPPQGGRSRQGGQPQRRQAPQQARPPRQDNRAQRPERPQGRPEHRPGRAPSGRDQHRASGNWGGGERPRHGAPARRGEERGRGPNKYGAVPADRSRVVADSPYFEEPRRFSNQSSPRRKPETPAPQPGASWFSRFLKKKHG
ncbi:MAG: DEAD/DEAH box helicase [Elusimicrobia bacterium]|nr:DEAD/DEAH box helicase [Elusimicrobiota bacterium]